jgi:mRNA-degrading endonuclease RelE of RelBE toxin-antitoxin system
VKWTVVWTATSERDFKRIDRETGKRIHRTVNRYAADSTGDVRRLQDVTPAEYRLRIGKWRVRFRLDHDAGKMHILRVLRRDEAY